MSEEKFSIMNRVHEFMDKLCDEHPDAKLVMFAVEFDDEGFPFTRSCKITGSPASSLAGMDMIARYMEEQKEQVYKKIDVAGELSGKIDELIHKMGFSGIDDPKFKEFINDSDSEISQKFKEMIIKIKKTFGK